MLLKRLLPFLLLTGVFITSVMADTDTKNEAKPISYYHAAIIMYHHISTQTPPSTSTSPDDFIKHLDSLEENGFEIWSLDRIAQQIKRRRPLPDKIAAITFDDGYISVYEEALPILKERKLPFTIFINADPVNEKRPLYMSWEQLKEAQEAGGIIANHTLSHPHLNRKLENETTADWLKRVEYEITANQQEIIQHLGDAPKLFAYPYGEYTPEVQKLVKKMGYIAFGQQSGAASPYSSITALPRFAANGTSANPSSLRTKLHSLPFPVISEEPLSTVLDGSNRRPSLKLTLMAGDYRLKQLRCYGPNSDLLKVDSKALEDGRVQITVNADKDLHTGRPRYNCTAPHKTQNRYFWFTRQWLMPEADGSWYDF